MDQTKTQNESVPSPEDVASDVLVSPDTRRPNRIPPGQSRTRKWPVLDASGAPDLDLNRWSLRVEGLLANPAGWTWEEFEHLPRVKVFSDFHCVTRWSRLGNLWEGVSTRTLVDLAGGLLPGATHALIHGRDSGWTTNLPISELLRDDCLVAMLHDGQPLSAEHGGPARLIVPQLYAWKSAKWIETIEVLSKDKAGFWERNGYHMHGDPWKEERFGW